MAFCCRICSNKEGNRTHKAREMHFGTKEEFEYVECSACGCVQIAVIPEDLSKYYPKDYYSFGKSGSKDKSAGLLRALRTRHVLGEGGFFGAVASAVMKATDILSVLKKAGLKTSSRILDAGSGTGGAFLSKLKREGFEHIEGADPFIDKDTEVASGVIVRKAALQELNGPYDAVFMNHSFEHVIAPAATLSDIARVLSSSGRAVITVPVAGTYAWKTYKTDWVGLDAPRHLHLNTVKSMKILAGTAGFDVFDAEFLSNPSGIWASEQYKRGIPLIDDRSYFGKKADEYFSRGGAAFTREEMEAFRKLDAELAGKNDSDEVRFYMRAAEIK